MSWVPGLALFLLFAHRASHAAGPGPILGPHYYVYMNIPSAPHHTFLPSPFPTFTKRPNDSNPVINN